MPREKRFREESKELLNWLKKTKKVKQDTNEPDTSPELSTMTSTQKDLVIKDNTEKNENVTKHTSTISTSISNKLLLIEQDLCKKLRNITFQSLIQYIYNPLEYAFETHAMYVRKYCNGTKKILFLGMNPGPWGMSQTGVPFGEINMVRDWLKISGPVGNPSKEHPDRKVTGFQCTRSEVSGQRLWGLFRDLCNKPENFFKYAYMHNYCPYAFMDAAARNITPAELKGEGQSRLHEACDRALIEIVKSLKVEIIVGIGRYAEKRALTAVQTGRLSIKVEFLPHPSPRAVGNQNWNEKAMQKLKELELLKFFESAA